MQPYKLSNIKSIITSGLALLLIASCGGGEPKDLAGKKKKLSDINLQLKELQQQAANLETEIAKIDTSFVTAQKVKLVQVDTILPGIFTHYIEVQGTVDAEENVLAINQMPGIVTGIFVKPGDRVSKGQVLATTDASAHERGVEAIQVGLSLATVAYEKQKRLWEQNIGSEIQLLQAKTQKETLEKQLKAQLAQVEMTKVKSPINGTVDEVRLKLGDMAVPSQAMPGIRVINTDKLVLKAKVSDSYLGKVRKNDKVNVNLPDIDKTISSEVSYVGQVVNPVNRTFNIEAKINNAKGEYAANMLAKLLINDEIQKDVLVVPTNVVQRSLDGIYVLVAEVENGKMYARRRNIKTGNDYNGQTVITEGLKPGDLVITFGFNELVDGQLITI